MSRLSTSGTEYAKEYREQAKKDLINKIGSWACSLVIGALLGYAIYASII